MIISINQSINNYLSAPHPWVQPFAVIDFPSIGEGLPPSYQSSLSTNVVQNDGDLVNSFEIKHKIADLEATIQKNSQEMQRMQNELASNFQKQLMDMQQKQLDALRSLFEEEFQRGIQEGQSVDEKCTD